ncbi:hypothetical protein DRN73_06180 [Candidatus Pacearchaeota archaeon]|nr:MAG: hypothetical protein DRN73_06180 [Candidatus Pacearchaeota archaeon]
MKKIILKKTKLKVSKFCLGTNRINHLLPEYGSRIIKKAYKKGINFWDTSDDYNTHSHVALALRGLPREKIIIMTKITNVFGKKVKPHIKKMLKELGTNYIDILLLHAVDSEKELKKYLEIIPILKKIKAIRHIGLSSHKPNIINKIAENKDIEFILAPFNYRGFRIRGDYRDKTYLIRRKKMKESLIKCKKNKKDIFLIKIFANGLIKKIEKAIRYGLKQEFSDGVNLGVSSAKELEEDIKLVNKILKEK